jgi:putative ABC transport system permease protein
MSKVRKTSLIRENLAIAMDVIWAHKLRSGLIILGVSIGVASLMGMVSILLGLGEKITGEITSAEETSLQVLKFDFLVGGFDEAALHRKEITEEDSRAVRDECTLVHHVGYMIQPQQPPRTLRYGSEKSRMIQLAAAEPSLFYVWSLELEAGRVFTEEELLHRARVVVLGHSPRRDLFPTMDPIGKKIKIGDEEFLVIGTFVQRKTLFGSFADNFAMIPYTTYLNTFWKEQDLRTIFMGVRQGVDIEAAKDEVRRVMRVRRKLKANQPDDFALRSADAILEFLAKITDPIAAVLAAISSVGLLVGGIGVMNMMLVSVTERTGEIGIRKAVGATRMDILWQFLIEAGTLTGLGGIFGVIIGLSAAFGMSALSGLPSRLSPFYIVLAVIFSISIGIFFGLYPANRASKLDPVNAMSYAKN